MLPLRLYAEPEVRRDLARPCFVLPTKAEDSVCLIIADHGLVAVAVQTADTDIEPLDVSSAEAIAKVIGCEVKCVPSLKFVCLVKQGKRTHEWHNKGVRVVGPLVRASCGHWSSATGQCQSDSHARACTLPQQIVCVLSLSLL